MNRREFLGAFPAAAILTQNSPALGQVRKQGVMLMNRIAPSSSDLYIANADGSGERMFLAGQGSFHGKSDWVWGYDPVGEWDKEPVVPAAYTLDGPANTSEKNCFT